MSLVRLLPAWFHAIADYAVALGLIVLAVAIGGTGKAIAAGVVIGAVVLVVSLFTRYPLGVVKVLPFKVHSAGDYLAAALLVASPFALGFTHSDRGLSIIYVGAGVAVLAVSLITNYQYGPQAATVQSSNARPAQARATAPVTRSGADRWFAIAAQHRSSAPAAAAPTYSAQADAPEPVAAQSFRSAPAASARPLREVLADQAANRRPLQA